MKSSSLTRLGLVGIVLVLTVVLFAAFFLRSPNNKVNSGATIRDVAQKISPVEEPQRNTPPLETSSRKYYSSHFTGGSEPSKPVIPVTASKDQPVTSNQISPEEQSIYLEGGFWLEKGPDGNWTMHR